MKQRRPLYRASAPAWLTLTCVLACSEAPSRAPASSAGATAGAATTSPPVGTGGGPLIEFTTGGGAPKVDDCAAETSPAEPAPLDIYLMLDISGSMLDETASGQQKWASVKQAITSFLADPSSADISVGIQYFPLRKAGVPTSCTTNAECATGGSCFLKRCIGYPVPGGVAQCDTDEDCKAIPAATNYGPCAGTSCSANPSLACTRDADCFMPTTQDFGPCRAFGICDGRACYPGEPCASAASGVCEALTESTCFHGTECTTSRYATPAVAIAPVATQGPMILASMEAQVPDGDTPSAPALRGAIEHAQAWAKDHPGHSVVTVLATDGLPTECLPDGQRFTETATLRELVDEVATVAYHGSLPSDPTLPAIPTFVIGVFAQNDTSAPENLRIIADGGGTEKAQIVSTDGDVTAQFLHALNAIRKSRLACEYQIPTPEEGKMLDFGAVNVDIVDSASGASEGLFNVKTSAGCDALGGWYYDVDPKAGNPTKILICPSTCDRFQNAGTGALQIKLGCTTRIR